jgi:murein DD-endopeptidase MepM/ murein hydrolase activator NlpD
MKNKTLIDHSYKRVAERQPDRKGWNPKIFFALFGVLLLCGSFALFGKFWKPESMTILNESDENHEDVAEGEINVKSYVVAEGDIPAEVFETQGELDANDVQALLAASGEVYDFTKIKIGQTLDFVFDDQEKAQKIKYYPDTENVIIAETKADGFDVHKEKIPYQVEENTLHIRIDEFLYKDALDAGLSEASILEIADVFSFDIDFTTEIRQGDELEVVYEKRTLHGEPAPDGKILAAEFINEGESHFAYYFEFDGEGSHYDGEGHELMRQFLRAPLSYRRITSGYTGARLHPITKQVTAHYQIDYAAPVGTPVVATARGTVSSAGWEGGWGNIIHLSHENGYTTHYGHLSAYAEGIKSGADVSQGQVIGYVGSTGWSTGPHLDYGMKLNGNPVNPMALKLPKGEPLSGEHLEKFLQEKQKYDEILSY